MSRALRELEELLKKNGANTFKRRSTGKKPEDPGYYEEIIAFNDKDRQTFIILMNRINKYVKLKIKVYEDYKERTKREMQDMRKGD